MQVHLVFGIYYDNFYLWSIALYTSAQHWLSLEGAEPVIADQDDMKCPGKEYQSTNVLTCLLHALAMASVF